MLSRRIALSLAVCSAFAAPAAAQQQTAGVPGSAVILSISGKLRGGQPVELSRTDIERLPRATVRTSTPWHDGVQVFEGAPLSALLESVGADGRALKVTALNHYMTEIPVDDAAKRQPILAYLRNGQPMSVRDKGPLFIIYPYDDEPSLKTELFYSRSAWQVRSIVVE